MNDQQAIDDLVRQFFSVFTNRAGATPDVRRLYELCIPSAVIVRSAGPVPEVYSLGEFVEPRHEAALRHPRREGVSVYQDVRRLADQRGRVGRRTRIG